MAIDRVEIKDFLVFKGEFACDLCPGVNVIIGGNATGKTTLLKILYGACKHTALWVFLGNPGAGQGECKIFSGNEISIIKGTNIWGGTISLKAVYIPEKDILEHAKGLLTFIEQKQTGFSRIYKDVLVNAQDIPTQKQLEMQTAVGRIISGTIGGTVQWDKGDGSFYTLRSDGMRIPFANEASGFKKFGYLGMLVACGQIESGSVLFWDEPENSLNPGLMPVLVDILLELQRGGVQIFLATHSYTFARYFDVKKGENDKVRFFNLSKGNDGQIMAVSSPEYTKLPESILDKADEQLYKAVVANAMGVKSDD